MIHILIADRHTLMRSAIRRLLGDEPDLSLNATGQLGGDAGASPKEKRLGSPG
jgi:DNA-binding NarL/FixJ family response regulator